MDFDFESYIDSRSRSHCFRDGAISLMPFESVVLNIRRRASQIRGAFAGQARNKVFVGWKNNQRAKDLSVSDSFYRRSESLLAVSVQWNIQPLHRTVLRFAFCPLCSQAIQRRKKNVAL